MKKILKYLALILGSVIVLLIISYLLIGTDRFERTDDISWGGSFSTEYARDLGLDWKDTYTQMLEDLPIKSVRVNTYWNEIEPQDDEFYFDDVDWQIEAAAKAGVDVLLVVGYKQPRWPECRKPEWLNDNRDTIREELREMLTETVNRYKDNEAVFAWQVENEPFLDFGLCLDLSDEFYKEEVTLVKSLDDTRPVVVTESGELSFWRHGPAAGADILGVTTYRVVWNPWFGTFNWFFLTPNYYRKKAQLVDENIKDFYFVELQAEPWGPSFITEMSQDQQLEIFPLSQLESNIQYGKDTGLKRTYLWGVEWWYYMREIHGNESVLERVKELLSE